MHRLTTPLIALLGLASPAAFADDGATVTHQNLHDRDCYSYTIGADVYDICWENNGVIQTTVTPAEPIQVTYVGMYSQTYSENGEVYLATDSAVHRNYLLMSYETHVLHLSSEVEVSYDLDGYCFESWSDVSYQVADGEIVRDESDFVFTPCE